jgi:hypothetical protein
MQLPALAAENRDTGAWHAGLLPRVFAVFLVLHGLVHVIGFTVPWQLGGLRGSEYSTRILNHSIEVGDTAVKILGLAWLAVAVAVVLVGVLVWRGHAWALRTTIALLLGSLVLCTIDLPASVMGLAIDVILLVLLAVAPDSLIVGRANRSIGEARSGRA